MAVAVVVLFGVDVEGIPNKWGLGERGVREDEVGGEGDGDGEGKRPRDDES